MTKKQTEEIIKCRENPSYFMLNYGKIRHPRRGLIDFELYDFQSDTLDDFLKYPYNIVLKARQLGLSTLVAAYCAWMATFFKNKEIYVIATKSDTAVNMIDKVKVFMENMPSWMTPTITINNRKSVELKNGSKVKASSTTTDAARSESLSLLVVDEAAFVKNMTNIWIAAQPTLSTGGDLIALSTPNGVGNWFHKMFTDAQNDAEIFVGNRKTRLRGHTLMWDLHPDRDQSWADSEKKKIGIQAFAQEHGCDFIHSGANVISPVDLQWYQDNPTEFHEPDVLLRPHLRDPMEKTGFDKNLWIWKYPDYSRSYLVCADVARGDGTDYSTFHVIDQESYEQVAEYRGKVAPDVFGHLLVEVSTKYNNAFLVVENNSIGFATLQKIIDIGYQHLYWSKKSSTTNYIQFDKVSDIKDPYNADRNAVPGFGTSSATRPLIISKLEEDIRNHDLIIHSKRLYDECMTFVFENGKPQSMQGYNDDLVMALAIGAYVRSSHLKMQMGIDVQNSILGSFAYTNTDYDAHKGKNMFAREASQQNTMKVGDHLEDISWLVG